MMKVTLYRSDFTDSAWEELMKELKKDEDFDSVNAIMVTLFVSQAYLTLKEKD